MAAQTAPVAPIAQQASANPPSENPAQAMEATAPRRVSEGRANRAWKSTAITVLSTYSGPYSDSGTSVCWEIHSGRASGSSVRCMDSGPLSTAVAR
ncbi:hypothetical protein SGLAM104S_09301 [Streptomyces glaucescens]